MSEHLEKALSVLDGYETQRSSEVGQYDDVAPPIEGCPRCQRPTVDDRMCGGCREFMLGDSDVDPAKWGPVCGPVIPVEVYFQRQEYTLTSYTSAMNILAEQLSRAAHPSANAPTRDIAIDMLRLRILTGRRSFIECSNRATEALE